MTPEDYIQERVDHQFNWYDDKSQAAQKSFKQLRTTEVVLAASIPFLAGLIQFSPLIPFLIGLIGVCIVILASVLSLNQYQENWIEYRTSCESLKHEKYLFLTASEPYDSPSPFPLFVERIEGLISKENSAWSQHTRAGAQASTPNERAK